MKKYILLTDDKANILTVIGLLVKWKMNFEYRASSHSLIFEVSGLEDAELISKALEVIDIRINEFKA